MVTKTINLYTFDELTPTAQDKAINNLSDINTSHIWWETVYDDAKYINMEITSFDIDRGRYCNSKMFDIDIVADSILSLHGEECETFILASKFKSDFNALVEKYSDGINKNAVSEDNTEYFDSEVKLLESEFKASVENAYLSILSKEYDYLTSREQIIETINANEYTFTEDGKLENL